jgi:hypothetical protein
MMRASGVLPASARELGLKNVTWAIVAIRQTVLAAPAVRWRWPSPEKRGYWLKGFQTQK